jgi:hypothetical protein
MILGSNLGRDTRSRSDSLRGPHSLPFDGYRGPFPGVERPGREVGGSPLSSAEVKNKWRYILLLFPLYAFMA